MADDDRPAGARPVPIPFGFDFVALKCSCFYKLLNRHLLFEYCSALRCAAFHLVALINVTFWQLCKVLLNCCQSQQWVLRVLEKSHSPLVSFLSEHFIFSPFPDSHHIHAFSHSLILLIENMVPWLWHHFPCTFRETKLLDKLSFFFVPTQWLSAVRITTEFLLHWLL